MASTVGSGGAPQMESSRTRERYEDDVPRGYGWVLFAGTMISIVGALNMIYGIAAISNSKFYVKDAAYVISDLKTWGWVMLGVGVVQLIAALGIWVQAEWGRWIGILTAGGNMIVQMLVIPSYPFLALSIFTIDVLVLYGLIAYGGRPAPTSRRRAA